MKDQKSSFVEFSDSVSPYEKWKNFGNVVGHCFLPHNSLEFWDETVFKRFWLIKFQESATKLT